MRSSVRYFVLPALVVSGVLAGCEVLIKSDDVRFAAPQTGSMKAIDGGTRIGMDASIIAPGSPLAGTTDAAVMQHKPPALHPDPSDQQSVDKPDAEVIIVYRDAASEEDAGRVVPPSEAGPPEIIVVRALDPALIMTVVGSTQTAMAPSQ